jgi:Mce-associated membrane protein
VAWWRAEHDDRAKTAERRDSVVIAATRGIETMNTLDYRKVESGLKAWSATTTGTLRDQLQQVGTEDQALLEQQKKVSTGRVIGLAVVELGTTTATVLASVQVTVRDGVDAGAEPTIKRNRFTADLVRVGGTWKLESLQQVAVHL